MDEAKTEAVPSGVVGLDGEGRAVFPLPLWARREFVLHYTGVPANVLVDMVVDGRVRARKVDPKSRNSACLFRLQDVVEAVEELPEPAWGKIEETKRTAQSGKERVA